MHTVVVSGDNGAGKSSIIDAITWALWGKSRAKSDDDLIHQGENETRVEFDFSSGRQLYRVIRQHARPKGKGLPGKSSLDFFVCNEGTYLPLTAERSRPDAGKIAVHPAHGLRHLHQQRLPAPGPCRRVHRASRPPNVKRCWPAYWGWTPTTPTRRAPKRTPERPNDEGLRLGMNIGEMEAELAQRPACQAELAKAEAEIADTIEALDGERGASQPGCSQQSRRRGSVTRPQRGAKDGARPPRGGPAALEESAGQATRAPEGERGARHAAGEISRAIRAQGPPKTWTTS